jgi:hypothetical protein
LEVTIFFLLAFGARFRGALSGLRAIPEAFLGGLPLLLAILWTISEAFLSGLPRFLGVLSFLPW